MSRIARPARPPAAWLAAAFLSFAAPGALPGGEAIIYSHPAPGGPLAIEEVHRPAGPGPHPAVLLVGGWGEAESPACCADWLARGGYAVFRIEYRAHAPYPAAIEDVRRAIRFLRFHAAARRIDPRRFALFGIGFGGYLASFAGVLPARLAAASSPAGSDAADRQSGAPQAVVSLHAWSDLRGAAAIPPGWREFLTPLAGLRGETAALAEASPVMHIRPDAPPFLLIHGDADGEVPFVQSSHWQYALQSAGVAANLILIRSGGHDALGWARLPGGVRDWEAETLEWMARVLGPGPGRRRPHPAAPPPPAETRR